GNRFRNSKIGDGRAATTQKDVVGLDVAVHDAAFVCIRECFGDVTQHTHRLCDRQRPGSREPAAQTLALPERHRVVGYDVDVAGRVNRYDVRVLKPRGDENLAIESLDAHARDEVRRQNFHYHAPAERRLLGDEDTGHAAATELPLDAVGRAK